MNRQSDELNIRERLAQLVKAELIDVWLNTPNPKFNNQKPIDMLLHKKDLKPLYEMLYILESGTPT